MHPAHEAADRVLGKAVIDAQVARRVVRDLRDEMWPSDDHRALFRGIRALVLEGAPVEVTTLAAKTVGVVRGSKVCELFEEITAADADYWVARLLDTWRERKFGDLLLACDRIRQEQGPWTEREQRSLGLIRDWARGHTAKSEAIVRLSDALAEAAMHGWQRGPQSGVDGWDKLLGGFAPGTLHILAGRPGAGKTTLMLRVAEQATKQGKAVVVVPLEMGELATAEWCSQMGIAPEADVHFIRTPDRRWSFVRPWLETACEQYHPALVMLDHLGHVSWPRPESRQHTRATEIGEILRDLKLLARQQQTAALLVCQLNRAVEHRRTARPVLADLRESGDIEQEADSVTFLWADPKERKKADVPTWLTVEKHRHGPPGDVALWFHRPTRAFRAREA